MPIHRLRGKIAVVEHAISSATCGDLDLGADPQRARSETHLLERTGRQIDGRDLAHRLNGDAAMPPRGSMMGVPTLLPPNGLADARPLPKGDAL